MPEGIPTIAIFAAAAVLCLAGLVLSCVSISGTWLVAAASALLAWGNGDAFPGWGTPIVFAVISAIVEGVEALAGWFGVTNRGGSGRAGVAALAGGLLGLIAGSMIPIPVLGSLLGMLAGSFLLAYHVENIRLKDSKAAWHIACGALMARVFVLLIKVVVTLGMIGFLAAGLWLGRDS